jgi:hypothetical protein
MIDLEEAKKIGGYVGEILTGAIEQEEDGDFDVDNFIDEIEKEFKVYRDDEEIAPIWGYGTYADGQKKDDRELNPWGRPYGERPKIVEANAEQAAGNSVGYRVVQIFPNRDDNTDYYVAFGTPSEIRIQTSLFLNLHSRLGGTGDSGKKIIQKSIYPVQGHPVVTMYFVEDFKKSEHYLKNQVEGEISFRLMDMSDNPARFPGSIPTLADMERLERLIQANFIVDEAGAKKGYLWNKGNESYSYIDEKNGLRLRLYCTSEAVAIELIKRILLVANGFTKEPIIFNRAAMMMGKRLEIPEPKEIQFFNKKIKEPRTRPKADVRFRWAKIEFSLGMSLWLIKKDRNIWNDFKSMNSELYQQ